MSGLQPRFLFVHQRWHLPHSRFEHLTQSVLCPDHDHDLSLDLLFAHQTRPGTRVFVSLTPAVSCVALRIENHCASGEKLVLCIDGEWLCADITIEWLCA